MEIKNIINDLCSVCGVSGSETLALDVCKKYLQDFTELSSDSNGNMFAFLRNKDADKTILIDAHIDRIGLIVTDIDDNGFVKVDKCGGIDVRTLQNTEFILQGNEEICGVVCCMPPHLTDSKEDKAISISKTWIDFGMTADEVKKHIRLGDVLTYKSKPIQLLNDKIVAPALDNRCGVAALIRCAELIKDKTDSTYNVVFLFSAQEETFGTGAKTGAYQFDADESIVVDVSFASQPDISGQYAGIEIGKGPMICISPILNRCMTDKLISIAENKSLPYQLEPISGTTGTNADHISVTKCGVKTSLISIPQRYMHTQAELISVVDVENTAQLIAEYIITGGAF